MWGKSVTGYVGCSHRLIPLTTNFLHFILLNFHLPKRIGAECKQVCAETMTGCGDLCVVAAQNVESVLPVGKCFFCPNADNFPLSS
jgi:hypothetical protein